MADEPNNITKLLTATIGPIQDIETALSQLLVDRAIDTAIGTQLDVIGRIVGQPRDGHDDDLYRRIVRARIASNRSAGVVEDILRVTDLVIYDDAAEFTLTREGTASYTVRVDGVAVTSDMADILIELIRDATSAGVRGIAIAGTTAPGTRFKFDGATGTGFDEGAFVDARD